MIKYAMSLIVIFCIIIGMDLNSLSKAKDTKKAVYIYSVILTIGFLISLFQIIGKAPTSPVIYIEKLIDNIAPNR